MDDDGKWSRACLRVFGDTLEPGEIGSVLGLKATHTHLKGELVSPRHPTVSRESGRLLESPLSKHAHSSDHLEWLLSAVEPKCDVIRELSKRYKVDFFCGFASGNGQCGFIPDGETLTRLAGLGVPLALDLYSPDPSGIGAEKPLTIQ